MLGRNLSKARSLTATVHSAVRELYTGSGGRGRASLSPAAKKKSKYVAGERKKAAGRVRSLRKTSSGRHQIKEALKRNKVNSYI
jgi:hypothetical protein